MQIRRATIGDASLLFGWANDPAARAVSFDPRPIAWEDHVDWLSRRLAAEDSLLFIADDSDGPVGQVRFDRSGSIATISVSVDASRRRAGQGKRLIALGATEAFRAWPITEIVAWVLPDNLASIGAFERAGFVSNGLRTERGRQAIHLTYERATDA
jgi:UDP-2,4-diacetamido-2,4,6-trideoxy-beta-L-altropyranose hydrolase